MSSDEQFEAIVLCISLLSTVVFIIVAVFSVKRFVSCIYVIDIDIS